MDTKDMFSFFLFLKNTYVNDVDILALFENYEITKLDINRIYRYLDKYTNPGVDDPCGADDDIGVPDEVDGLDE